MSNLWQQLNHDDWTDVQHARVRERLVRYMAVARAEHPEPIKRVPWVSLPRFSPAVIAAALAVLLGGSGVTVAMAAGSEPQEALYPVRVFAQEVRTRMTFNPVKKAELVARFSEQRLAEIRTLATMQAAAEGRGRADVVLPADKRLEAFRRNGRAMKRFAHLAEKQMERLREREDGGDTDEAAAHLDAVLDASLGILLGVETNAPADEPVRAVVAKTKQAISPAESAVERVMNERSVKALERFSATVATSTKVDDDDDADEKREAGGGSAVAEQATSGEGGVFATARIESARRSIVRAEELLGEAKEKYGDDAVAEMKRALSDARIRLEKAEAFFKGDDYKAAFTEAGEVMRIAAHLKVYLPIMEKRAKVLVDENTQLRLYILPKYLDDLKPIPVTGTVSEMK